MENWFQSLITGIGPDIEVEDKVAIGIIAAKMGTHLHSSLGFRTNVQIALADPRPGKEVNVDFWVQKLDTSEKN